MTEVVCEIKFKHFYLSHAFLLDLLFPVGYTHSMTYELCSTPTFDKWLAKLKDASTRNRLLARIDRIETGNFGDFKQIDNNLFELRFFFRQWIADLLHRQKRSSCSAASWW